MNQFALEITDLKKIYDFDNIEELSNELKSTEKRLNLYQQRENIVRIFFGST